MEHAIESTEREPNLANCLLKTLVLLILISALTIFVLGVIAGIAISNGPRLSNFVAQ